MLVEVDEGVAQVGQRVGTLWQVDEIVRSNQTRLVEDAHDVGLSVTTRDVTEHHRSSFDVGADDIVFEGGLIVKTVLPDGRTTKDFRRM